MEIINKIINYLMPGFAFLLPVFFLPNVSQPALIGKQIFLAVFVFIFAGLWIFKILQSRQLKFFWSKSIIFVFALLFVFCLANIFSLSQSQSFWGMNFEPDTTFSFILYSALFFFCLQFTAENKKLVVLAIKGLLAGSLVLSGIFFLQHLGWKFWPFALMKDTGFSSIGFSQAMALFLGGVLVFLSAYLTFAKDVLKKKKIVLFGCLAIFLAVLILVNMPNVWLALGIVLLLLIVCCLILKKRPWLVLGLLAVVVLFFITQWGSLVKLPGEVMASQKVSFNIARAVVFSNFKSFVLGSGPATFIFDYDLLHPLSINQSQFWNLRFSQGAGFFPTLLACCGFLGLLAFLCLIGFLITRIVKVIGIGVKKISALQIAVLMACVFYFVCLFFYQANFALITAGFIFLAFLESYFAKEKIWKWKSNLKIEVVLIAICLVIFILIIAGFYKTTKSYLSAVVYARANQEYSNSNVGKKTISGLEKASKLDLKDIYLRTLTQALNLKIKQMTAKPGFDNTELQNTVSLAEKAGLKASQIGPRNSQNWLNLAIFYEILSGLKVQKAADSALDCLKKAGALSPSNPQIPLMISKLYISASQQKTIVEQRRNQFLDFAIEYLNKSIILKSNYSSAYYLLGVCYEMQGKNDLAIQNYQKVLQIEPSNKEATQRLSVLQQ